MRGKNKRYFDYFSMTVYLPFQEESVDLFLFLFVIAECKNHESFHFEEEEKNW